VQSPRRARSVDNLVDPDLGDERLPCEPNCSSGRKRLIGEDDDGRGRYPDPAGLGSVRAHDQGESEAGKGE
jgi:hypothetical protein